MDGIDFKMNDETLDMDEDFGIDDDGVSSFITGLLTVNKETASIVDIVGAPSSTLWKFIGQPVASDLANIEDSISTYIDASIENGLFADIDFEVEILERKLHIKFEFTSDNGDKTNQEIVV